MKAFAALALLSVAHAGPDEYDQAFSDYVKRFKKEYHGGKEHVDYRFSNFKQNYIYIARENAKGTNKYTLSVNDFTDMSKEEFKSTHYGFQMPEKPWGNAKHLGVHTYKGEDLPDSVDWNAQGAVTPVKNQASCGSCWAFSSTGSLEGAWFKATGTLVSLSEEQLVQCSTMNNACQGGSMPTAFQFEETVAVCTEDSYPYTSGAGQVGSCQAAGCTAGIPKGGVTGYHSVTQDDMQAMMSAVAQQPVSIAIEADTTVFQSYSSGVMTDTCGTKLDHGVLCVGYGEESGTKYWLVKNSWGSSWGDAGYAKLERGKGDEGECGILHMASYPEVSGSVSPTPTPPAPSPVPSPTPGPTPAPTPPAPTPSGCADVASFCAKDYTSSTCPSYAFDICKKTCGCCSSAPPSGCPKDGSVIV